MKIYIFFGVEGNTFIFIMIFFCACVCQLTFTYFRVSLDNQVYKGSTVIVLYIYPGHSSYKDNV